MVAKKKTNMTAETFFQRVFALMFGAVGVTAITSLLMILFNGILLLFNFETGNPTPFYYIVVYGGLGFSIWAQFKAFSFRPAVGALMLMIYSVLIGVALTPLLTIALMVNPFSIFFAFAIAAAMFACMALFGYKTAANLSFLGRFLFIGMIGLVLTAVASNIWPLGDTFATIVCYIGVLVFALFTAYDMQALKQARAEIGDERAGNQLAVLGALHLYISFIAMFQYILSLFNRR